MSFQERYQALAHAVQTGAAQECALDDEAVAFNMRTASSMPHSPKMLRTGVNMALVEGGALAQLLMDKGVITAEEYQGALIASLEAEVARYEARLSKRMGIEVRLA